MAEDEIGQRRVIVTFDPEAPAYGGNEHASYIRADRFAEDMLWLRSAHKQRRIEASAILHTWLAPGTDFELTTAHRMLIHDWQYAETRLRPKRSRFSAVPRALRDAVFARDGRICADCGSTEDLTLDHKHPQARGGKHTPDNLRVLCRTCNSRKGATVPVGSHG